MWEFTSVEGLNFATNGKQTVSFYCEDEVTGKKCYNFGFDVGQPQENPPIHKFHRDLGWGKVKRIYYFRTLNNLCYEFTFGGNDYVVELDGSREELELKFYHTNLLNSHVQCFLCLPDGSKVKLEDSTLYIILGKHLKMVKIPKVLPQPDLSLKEALRQCVYVNTVRTPDGKLYVPVNRAWTKMMGEIYGYNKEDFSGPFMFIWDTAFNSYLASFVDLKLAEENIKLLLESNLRDDGYLVQCRVGEKVNNLTGLPVLSYVVLKIYQLHGNYEFVENVFSRLYLWHWWLRKNRDKNKNLLFEWGYEEVGDIMIDPEGAAGYESGMDNTPMYEEATVNRDLKCIEMDCVDLSSFYALDSLCLAELAKILKRDKEYEFLTEEYNEVKNQVNKLLWDKERGLYVNRHWNGKFAEVVTPTSFYPMIAKIPTEEQSKILIKNLVDEKLFWGEFVIPSVAKNLSCYDPDGDYWRGRIWPPINFFVYEGLRNYDEKLADELKEKSLKLFHNEWIEHNHIHENYSALTGKGEPQPGVYARSCPFYTWGGLMFVLSM